MTKINLTTENTQKAIITLLVGNLAVSKTIVKLLQIEFAKDDSKRLKEITNIVNKYHSKVEAEIYEDLFQLYGSLDVNDLLNNEGKE